MTEKEKLANTIEILETAKDSYSQLTPEAKSQLLSELSAAYQVMKDITKQEESAKPPEKIHVVIKTKDYKVTFHSIHHDHRAAESVRIFRNTEDSHSRYTTQEYVLPKKQNTEALEKLEADLHAVICDNECQLISPNGHCNHCASKVLGKYDRLLTEYGNLVIDVKAYIATVKGE